MKVQEKYNKEVCLGFQTNRGKGSVYCFPPLKYDALVVEVLNRYRTKRPTEQILIVVDDFIKRLKLVESIRANGLDNANIKILTKDYIKDSAHYSQNLIIAIDVIDYFTISKFHNSSQFTLLIFTKNPMNNQFIIDIRRILPEIAVSIGTNEIIFDRIKSPVKEHRIGVELTDEDKQNYDKCNKYINESISVFGDFDAIKKCRSGDPEHNISAAEFRQELAYKNGWNYNLDTTVGFNKQIDDIYNPNALLEKASIIYNIIKERLNLVTDNKVKLPAIDDIISQNEDKKILIICKRGEFANIIYNHINNDLNISCGAYHDDIESQYVYDELGNVIVYKTGANKGKPRPFAAQSLSNMSLDKFNNSNCNVLVVKNNLSQKIHTKVDIVILTSPLCMDTEDFILKYVNVELPNPIIIYKLYTINTIEYIRMNQKQIKSNITIIEEQKNIEFDEESGDIIL